MNRYLETIKSTITSKQFYNIGFLGDSITSTEWIHPNWREITRYVLEEELTKAGLDWQLSAWYIKTINAGFNGATTRDILTLMQNGLLAHKPKLIIFINTVNDMDLGLTSTEHAQNTTRIIEILKNNIEHVIVCTSSSTLNEEYNTKYLQFIRPMLKNISTHNIHFIDLLKLTSKVDKSEMYTFTSINGNPEMGIKPGAIDFAHPNNLGNAYIAKVLLKEIFEIEFNYALYADDSKNDIKHPKY